MKTNQTHRFLERTVEVIDMSPQEQRNQYDFEDWRRKVIVWENLNPAENNVCIYKDNAWTSRSSQVRMIIETQFLTRK